MQSHSFKNPFVQKIRMLTNLLLLSVGLNIAFGATLFYHFSKKKTKVILSKDLPAVEVRREHSDLLHSFFQMSFNQLVLELSNKQEIADGYKVCDLALGILTSYHYLDLSKALMGESIEEREVMFIHTDGGEQFSLCLYPNVKEYHYSLIKGFIKECKYPWTSEGLFAELKIKKENAPTDLTAAFMMSKEFIAIYTFVHRFLMSIDKERLLLLLLSGSYADVERFYYLYLENMDRPKDMMRHFFKTYSRHNSCHAADMWLEVDESFILHQLNNEEIAKVIELTTKESFLKKVQQSLRKEEIRELAKNKLQTPVMEDVLCISSNEKHTDKEAQIEAEKETELLKLEQKSLLYTIQIGDSLWKIANKHKVSLQQIREINQLNTDLLKPGQTIIIPTK